MLYADLGYRLTRYLSRGRSGSNLQPKTSDIEFFHTSRLPGEPLAGVDDVHTLFEPREARRVSDGALLAELRQLPTLA